MHVTGSYVFGRFALNISTVPDIIFLNTFFHEVIRIEIEYSTLNIIISRHLFIYNIFIVVVKSTKFYDQLNYA